MALEDRFYRKFLKILTQIHEKGTSVFSTPSQFPFVFFFNSAQIEYSNNNSNNDNNNNNNNNNYNGDMTVNIWNDQLPTGQRV